MINIYGELDVKTTDQKLAKSAQIYDYEQEQFQNELNKQFIQTIDSKVDKVTGKSLVDNTEINKLINLDTQSTIDRKIAAVQNSVDVHKNDKANPHQVSKSQIGLGNVTNDAQVKRSEIGVANGVVPLDSDSLIPSQYLPSYVDDVIEVANYASLPSEDSAQASKIYVTLDTNLTYRWGGTEYVEISKSLALGETASTAYAGDKGAANATAIATHTGNTNNPHGVTKSQVGLGNVDNTSDLNKPVSTATQTELNKKVDKIEGKGLSTEDYTTADKTKLAGIASGAQVNSITGVKGGAEESYRTGNVNITATNLGLGNVNNTSDADKPISTATQTALNNKVDKVTGKGLSSEDYTSAEKTKLSGIESGAQVNTITGIKGSSESSYRTGNVSISPANIGLGNVDNTSDLSKPISTATQSALDKKVDKVIGYSLSKNDFTDILKNKLDGIAEGAQVNSITGVKGSSEETYRIGNVSISASNIGLGNVNNTSDADKPISIATQTALNGKVSTTVKINGHALNADVTVSKSDVGLGNVDNTSDANKPVSTAQQTALDKKVDKTTTVNGHALSGNVTVTKTDIGLGNVDNTSDLNKPISTAVQTALDGKLSTSITTMPNPNPIKVQVKEVDLIEYDGSAVKTINLTCSDNITITSSGSTITIGGGTYSEATNTRNGLISSTDKAKLDNIESGAQVNSITGVKGNAEGSYRTGNINITPTNIGLGNVDNTSDLSKPISTATQGALDGKVDKIAGKGLSTEDFTGAYKTVLDNLSTNYAPLVDGLVPAANLPSYVDDIIEAESKNKFPTTGESGNIYVALDTNLTYRWSGTGYVEISKSLALGFTESTAYPGNLGAEIYPLAINSIQSINDSQTSDDNKTTLTVTPVTSQKELDPIVFNLPLATDKNIGLLSKKYYTFLNKWELSNLIDAVTVTSTENDIILSIDVNVDHVNYGATGILPGATNSKAGLLTKDMYNTKKVSQIQLRQGSEDVETTITNHSIYVTYDVDNIINGLENHKKGGDYALKIPNATSDYDGSMSYTDKIKLDSLPELDKIVTEIELVTQTI